MKFYNDYIEIVTFCGDTGTWMNKEQMARVYGHLAIHPMFRDKSKSLITHVPTGQCFPHEFDTFEQAKEVMKLLSDGYDWDFTDLKLMPVGVANFFRKQVKRVCGVEQSKFLMPKEAMKLVKGKR